MKPIRILILSILTFCLSLSVFAGEELTNSFIETTAGTRDFDISDFIYFRNLKIGPVSPDQYGETSELIGALLRRSSCDSETLSGLKRSLNRLGQMQSHGEASASFKAIFGNSFDGKILIQWIFKRVKNIKCGWLNFPHASIPFRGSGRGSAIFPKGYSGTTKEASEYSITRLIGAILHESKHTEGVRTGHIDVEMPQTSDGYPKAKSCFGQGLTACDDSFSDPYGIQAIFHANAALYCSTCSTEEKKIHTKLSLESLSSLSNPIDRAKLIIDLKYDDLIKLYDIDLEDIN